MELLTKIVKVSSVFLVLFITSSCDSLLNEKLKNEVTADNYFETDEQFVSAMGDAYNPFAQTYGSNQGLGALMVASDDFVVPQKGADWEDGGIWIRLHRHTFTPNDPGVEQAWTQLFAGVSSANRLLFQFQDLIERGEVSEQLAVPFLNELRAVRAYYYYLLLDRFGNVPIITSFEDARENPSQPSSDFETGRKEVFEFVESELLQSLDNLETDVVSTRGRMNKWVAHTTLSKLYLNAEVYTGEPRWEDAITHANAVIESGNYTLMGNYSDNFTVDNNDSPENIFLIPYDKVFLPGFTLHEMTLCPSCKPVYGMTGGAWAGFQATTDFYALHIDPERNPGPQGTVIGLDEQGSETTGTLDERLNNLIVGPQYSIEGERIVDGAAISEDPDGPPVTLTPYINELEPQALRQSGARVGKYQFEIGLTGSNMSNSFVVHRYSDVLLTKAEALWRLNPGSSEALMLVNEVRARSGVDGFSELTADNLLEERARETFYEMVRRQDLIRFEGKVGSTRFNDPWQFKEVSEDYRNVFPIPLSQIEANANLIQNPGY